MSVVASRYAKALFALGKETGQLETIERELNAFCALWEQYPELRALFANPEVNAEQRRAVLLNIVQRSSASETLRNTLWLLSDRSRMKLIPDIREHFSRMAEESLGRLRAEVTTATPLPEAYYEQLRIALEAVSGKKIVLQRKHDPSIIAGVVTRVGDQVFDGSARNHLAELKDKLLQSQSP